LVYVPLYFIHGLLVYKILDGFGFPINHRKQASRAYSLRDIGGHIFSSGVSRVPQSSCPDINVNSLSMFFTAFLCFCF